MERAAHLNSQVPRGRVKLRRMFPDLPETQPRAL